MDRRYHDLIRDHFRDNRQMLFLMGPRQVGKTTSSRQVGREYGEHYYFNWDNQEDRRRILAGPQAIAAEITLDRLREHPPLCIFDELHKFGQWKNFLKGFFDTHGVQVHILVTGSARLDVFKAGGDSLMGRYFGYRMHPLSVGEINGTDSGENLIEPEPRSIPDDQFESLLKFGGFPEPFLKQDSRFQNRWRRTRNQQLFQEDLRDLTRIQELGQVEILAELLRQRAGQLVSYASLARAINASLDSVRRWVGTLESLYFCYSVRPWHRNVARSLRKEPKYYLWDWSILTDPGARNENLVASALLKSVHFWTDAGYGDFGLYFLRDKQKREVDFLVVRDDQPWFLVEVKTSGRADLSPGLAYFQKATGASFAFQAAIDMPFHKADCFSLDRPMIVPARTLLGQLV